MEIERWDEAWGPLSEANMKRRLEAEGFAVSRYTKNGTPFHLEFSRSSLTGKVYTIAHDPPVDATGEQFVVVLSIVLNK